MFCQLQNHQNGRRFRRKRQGNKIDLAFMLTVRYKFNANAITAGF